MKNDFTPAKLTIAGRCVALGILLPMLFHGVPEAGPRFLPMHIPVLLAGFFVGWKLGLLTGIVTPLLSAILTGMPTFTPPMAFVMMFELAAYGLLAGLLYKRTKNIHVSLVVAMIGGRIIRGLAQWVLWSWLVPHLPFGWEAYVTLVFVTALPGIVLQLAVMPLIVAAVIKAYNPIDAE